MRQEVHSLVQHTSDVAFADLVQRVNRAAKECNFTNQSGTSTLTGMLISSCNNVEMNKWISDNIMELTNMPSSDEFKQAVMNSHNDMILNKGLPLYNGKRVGSAKSYVNSMSTQRQKQDQWEKTLP